VQIYLMCEYGECHVPEGTPILYTLKCAFTHTRFSSCSDFPLSIPVVPRFTAIHGDRSERKGHQMGTTCWHLPKVCGRSGKCAASRWELS
jgi:hypothetical protein